MSSPERRHPLLDVRGLTSARVSDTLDLLGRRSQVMDPVVVPVTAGRRAVGVATTVRFVPATGVADGADPYADAIAFIDGLRPGDFVVVSTGGDPRSAYWGQLFSAAARGHGAVGVVCDGYVRDTAEIAQLGWPVFARGRRPIDYRDRMEIESVGSTVTCAGVDVTPGDVVVADDDGVVVVPADVADAVAEHAAARATSEGIVLDELLGGASLREVWDRHRVL